MGVIFPLIGGIFKGVSRKIPQQNACTVKMVANDHEDSSWGFLQAESP